MNLEFTGQLWFWKGPSPFHFVTVPEEYCQDLQAASDVVSYGWGMIPVKVRIGKTGWKTSLWPKDGKYILPIKDLVRRSERLSLGGMVKVNLFVDI